MSDLRMPKMDGLELLRRIRGRWPDIAVVMITAVADVEVAVSCLAIGAMDYLTKPFHLEEVRARVAQALEKRRLVVENRGYQESLQEKVAVQARRLEELFLASVQSLAEALEVKDPYTRGHSVRVSHYSVVIARELGLDGEMLRQIELGGHVHDIGKIGVREEVLNKPGKLTDDEWAMVRRHPSAGVEMLADIEFPWDVRPIVESHHERWDGKGYPHGLAGDDIPLTARVLCIADVYDALTSQRSYKKAYAHDEAIAIMRGDVGRQFDPALFPVFEEIARGGGWQQTPVFAPLKLIA
jgi:putative nucleotidyltransferase with HDIG domain